MRRFALQLTGVVCATALTAYPTPTPALVPVFAALAQQLVQQTLTSMVKDALLNSLRETGCKGAALANALSALDLRSAGGLGGSGAFAQAMPGVGALPGGIPPGLLAQMPPGVALDAEQMAMLATFQQQMATPATPAQALETVDELATLGLLPPEMQREIHECMVLFPQTAQAIGMGMGMIASVLPKLREAREQMHSLSPAEQDEFASTIAAELQSVPAAERDAFVDQLGGGFFPPRVVAGVRAQLR